MLPKPGTCDNETRNLGFEPLRVAEVAISALFRVSTKLLVPVKPTPVSTRSNPGPRRWKSWIEARSLIRKR
jgi:hypothetical protein